jgi:hypothetical protein
LNKIEEKKSYTIYNKKDEKEEKSGNKFYYMIGI